ncbi:unnamed protein product [Linum trigynum]|uniref:Uncharacterized protein n=1 Tax=Linum trigynum TaxID=586398 RepID=A0AAV2CX93_9ROSI
MCRVLREESSKLKMKVDGEPKRPKPMGEVNVTMNRAPPFPFTSTVKIQKTRCARTHIMRIKPRIDANSRNATKSIP